jgi:hypothetical protein
VLGNTQARGIQADRTTGQGRATSVCAGWVGVPVSKLVSATSHAGLIMGRKSVAGFWSVDSDKCYVSARTCMITGDFDDSAISKSTICWSSTKICLAANTVAIRPEEH